MTQLGTKERYRKEVHPALVKEFGYDNDLAVPRLTKAVVNIGFGKRIAKMTGAQKEKFLELVQSDLAAITGQKLSFTKAKQSIAGFTLRQGEVIGAKITLRGRMMYDFITRLINVALPRSRDFQGIKRQAVDQYGNLTIGIKEQSIFPEADTEGLKDEFGFQVTIKSSTENREEALRLFELMGFPLQ